jgi:tRNA-2-methylthio-N6-dimethylallyladenosine synthase
MLQAMRRRHTREEFLDLVEALKTRVPGIQLSTDMIVGFPGETPADFEETLSLVEAARFHSMFSFKYSERPNTLAAKRLADTVPEEEKSARIIELQAVQREIQLDLHQRAVGTRPEILVDGVSRRRETELSGRTTGNTVVNFPGDDTLVGQFVRVLIERAGPHSLWGRIEGAA